MRIGIHAGLTPRGDDAFAELLGTAREAAGAGLDLWMPQMSDVDGAREQAARMFAIYNELPSYRAMLDKEGAAGPADVAVVGDEEAVAGALRHLGDIGATELSLPVFGSSEERARTLALLGELAAS
ncbi:MAG: hypothetical protein ACYC1D_00015 [Acidimicrobiales bacterium]